MMNIRLRLGLTTRCSAVGLRTRVSAVMTFPIQASAEKNVNSCSLPIDREYLLQIGRLVVGWVTTSEHLYFQLLLQLSSPFFSALLSSPHLRRCYCSLS